jgi:hypothetical protein
MTCASAELVFVSMREQHVRSSMVAFAPPAILQQFAARPPSHDSTALLLELTGGDAIVTAEAPAPSTMPAPPKQARPGKAQTSTPASGSALAERGKATTRRSAQAAGDAADSSLHQVCSDPRYLWP